MMAAAETPEYPPHYVKGFGRAVRLATAHRFHSTTTREQVAGPDYLAKRKRAHIASLVLWVAVLGLMVWFRGWIGGQIAAAMVEPLSGILQAVKLGGAILALFLGAFAFMRLGEAALRALFDEDDPMEWPREGVDWGRQTVILDRDTIAVDLRLVRRDYPWTSLAMLHEDEVFVVERRQGDRIVIPKDPSDEDELSDRLLRGITLAEPLR